MALHIHLLKHENSLLQLLIRKFPQRILLVKRVTRSLTPRHLRDIVLCTTDEVPVGTVIRLVFLKLRGPVSRFPIHRSLERKRKHNTEELTAFLKPHRSIPAFGIPSRSSSASTSPSVSSSGDPCTKVESIFFGFHIVTDVNLPIEHLVIVGLREVVRK